MIKFITYPFNELIKFIVGLIDKDNPLQVHNVINLIWGVGSFIFYWLDHFIKNRIFTNDDFMFIAAMCGMSLITAAVNNRMTKIDGAATAAPYKNIKKEEFGDNCGDG